MQLMTAGFIHCDPHEGNLLALKDGTGRVALLDFGLMAQMRLESDRAAREQRERFGTLNAKLDTLLTGEHKTVFRFFMLIPAPAKGYMGKAMQAMRPRYWFAKPMLLIPLYRTPKGELKRAPVATREGGFEVLHPRDFVKAHPRTVQIAMLALQATL